MGLPPGVGAPPAPRPVTKALGLQLYLLRAGMTWDCDARRGEGGKYKNPPDIFEKKKKKEKKEPSDIHER